MKATKALVLAVSVVLLLSGILGVRFARAETPIRISCSNQVYNAFEIHKIKAFTEATGIQVEIFRSSSSSALLRMMRGYSDIAATARGLNRSDQESGYTQIAICKDPMAVIARKACGVESISTQQVIDIFSGKVKNWQQIGGADLPVFIIAPGKNTAAYENFNQQIMKHNEIHYDFMSYDSTMVIDAMSYFPCGAVSFISGGASVNRPDVICIKIDATAPSEAAYPYYQIFYYAMKGTPSGAIKQYLDFTFSESGAQIIRKNGMLPLTP